MPITNFLILGGGMAGIASAIALSRSFPSPTQLKIAVYELRSKPSTIGGAVNLTPTALRCLDILGVLSELDSRKAGAETNVIQIFSLHTGASLGNLDYAGPEGKGHGGYKGRRVMRSDLLDALLAVAGRLENVEVVYGKKAAQLHETEEKVTVTFYDGTEATGDVVLGCDGIHSTTRMKFVEPSRAPTYSGMASAYGFTDTKDVSTEPGEEFFFRDTAVAMSRFGALLTTYCDHARKRIYVAAVMETRLPPDESKEGWRALGEDKEVVKKDVVRRFEKSALPKMKELVHGADEWFLYPVFKLEPDGKWCTGRVMLLGDAAHAMPPRGESIGYALEDAIIFSTVLSHFGLGGTPAETFHFYEKIRRKPIDDAYRDASMGWDSNKDKGWLATKIVEWFTPWYLWWIKASMEKSFRADPRDIQFDHA